MRGVTGSGDSADDAVTALVDLFAREANTSLPAVAVLRLRAFDSATAVTS